MTRPALHEVLTQTARKLDVNVRLGTTFTSIDTSGALPKATFTDGTEREYDFIVASDGVHSQVRSALFGAHHQPKFTGQGVWRYNVPRPKDIHRTFMCIGLKGGKCGFVPLNEQTGYILLVQSEPGNPKHPQAELANIMRSRLQACTGLMGALRDQITDPSLVVYRPLEAILMPSPWYKGGVLMIGDAVQRHDAAHGPRRRASGRRRSGCR